MIGIYYEHPHWFTPFFAELDARGTPYRRLHAEHHGFDPGRRPEYDLGNVESAAALNPPRARPSLPSDAGHQ